MRRILSLFLSVFIAFLLSVSVYADTFNQYDKNAIVSENILEVDQIDQDVLDLYAAYQSGSVPSGDKFADAEIKTEINGDRKTDTISFGEINRSYINEKMETVDEYVVTSITVSYTLYQETQEYYLDCAVFNRLYYTSIIAASGPYSGEKLYRIFRAGGGVLFNSPTYEVKDLTFYFHSQGLAYNFSNTYVGYQSVTKDFPSPPDVMYPSVGTTYFRYVYTGDGFSYYFWLGDETVGKLATKVKAHIDRIIGTPLYFYLIVQNTKMS